MNQSQLRSLLAQWASIEPQRCRQLNEVNFKILYQGTWYSITDVPSSHGMLIAAILDSCQSNAMYCAIEYQPCNPHQMPEIKTSFFHNAFTCRGGEEVISKLPESLLYDYLERLEYLKRWK